MGLRADMPGRRGTQGGRYPSGYLRHPYTPGYTIDQPCIRPRTRTGWPYTVATTPRPHEREWPLATSAVCEVGDMRYVRGFAVAGRSVDRQRWLPSWRGLRRASSSVMRLREYCLARAANRNAADVPIKALVYPSWVPSAFRLVKGGQIGLAQAHHPL